MGDEAKNYKRLGHLVAEYEEHHDDQGELIGAGMFAAELYACDTCHAVVWWGSMSDHDAWHKAHDGPLMVAVEESDDLDW